MIQTKFPKGKDALNVFRKNGYLTSYEPGPF